MNLLLRSNTIEELVFEGIGGPYPLGMVKLQHLVEQIKGQGVFDLAELRPRDLFFLHFIRDQRAITVFKSNFFQGIRAEQASQWDQVRNGKVFDLTTVIQTKNWVATGAEGKKYDSTGPYIDC